MSIIVIVKMNKCEHGQKITHFCATDNCQHKESAGCDLCLKKYHNHITHIVHLSEQEVSILLKKFSLDNSIKPKCRILQEAVYNYFNQIKTELISALQASCKNIINQIGYPYLFSTNTLTTYKRLKNKQYRKIQQKQFRQFFEVATKTQEKELAKEENRIYNVEIKTISDIIVQLDSLFKNMENMIKNYSGAFVHDGSYIMKITQVIKTIGAESPMRIKRSVQASKDSKELVESKYNSKQMPKFNLINSPQGFIQGNTKLDYKVLQAKATQLKQKVEKVEAECQPLLPAPSIQLSTKNHKERDISLDKKLVKDHRFNQETNHDKSKEAQSSESKIPNQKIENLKLQLNHKELQINQKKKILMDIMKSTEKQEKLLQKYESIQLSPTRQKNTDYSNYPKKQQLSTDTKSVNESKSSKSSQDLSGLQQQSKISDTKNYAFAKLPIEQIPKKQEEKQLVNRKLMIIPTDLNVKGLNNKNNQVDSPLYKKRKVQNYFQQSKFKDENQDKIDFIGKKYEGQSKTLVKEVVVQIKQNEEKSIALLLKSLSLSAQEAVTYLQSSLKYADNNLSTAEYLSYLYLQLNRPKDCLHLCNKILDKLQSTNDPQVLSVNINNNKAAALNTLGRYSQAILILQQCIKYNEKDTFYKNLADSYFSIGMFERAIFNYQKSIKLNSHNDECHYNLAVCLYLQQNYEYSKLSIKRALEMQSKNEAYLQLQSHIDAKNKII